MPSFRQGDIVKVPFPYTDRATRQHRPAFVLTSAGSRERHHLVWVLMITSAENPAWAGDITIPDHAAAGLPAPSVVRTAKIATVDARDAEHLGRGSPRTTTAVVASVKSRLAAGAQR